MSVINNIVAASHLLFVNSDDWDHKHMTEM